MPHAAKPFSQASERNQQPILEILRDVLAHSVQVLEIGSGTGQHAVFFARHLPHLQWQTSDLPDQHAGILAWIADAALPNLRAPLALDVDAMPWPVRDMDAVFSANTAHIVAWPQVRHMFQGVGRTLKPGGLFCLYGPFNYAGKFTSDSNAQFDVWLKQRDARSGIRDFEALDALAQEQGMLLAQDAAMPANNRILVWRKRSTTG
jgi:SAM-dependent methyltransferase